MKDVIITDTEKRYHKFISKLNLKHSQCVLVQTVKDLEPLKNIRVFSIKGCHNLPEFTRMIDRCDAIRAVQPS